MSGNGSGGAGAGWGSTKLVFVDPGPQWYYKWTVLYLQLYIIPSSVLCNLFVLLTLPRSSVRMNQRCRYLYVFFTVWDTVLIFFKDVVEGYLADGLYLATNGRFFLNLQTISPAMCKIFRGLRFSTEVLADYTLTLLTLERYLVICFPLAARSQFTMKRTVLVHLAILMPLVVWMHVATALLFSVVATPGTVTGLYCVTGSFSGTLGFVNSMIVQQVQYSVHTLLDLILDLLTIVKLAEVRRKRALMTSNAPATMSASELRLTVLMIWISVLNSALFLPCAVTWPMYSFYSVLQKTTQAQYDTFLLVANLAHTFILLTGIDRTFNFLLLLHMPSFRRSVPLLGGLFRRGEGARDTWSQESSIRPRSQRSGTERRQ